MLYRLYICIHAHTYTHCLKLCPLGVFLFNTVLKDVSENDCSVTVQLSVVPENHEEHFQTRPKTFLLLSAEEGNSHEAINAGWVEKSV